MVCYVRATALVSPGAQRSQARHYAVLTLLFFYLSRV